MSGRGARTLRCFLLLAWGFAPAAGASDAPVRLNTVGYLPDRPKRASIPLPCSDFAVVRVPDGKQVLTGKASGPARNADTGEELFTADFTAVTEPGVYRLEIPGAGRSPDFRVAADVYDEPFRLATRAMYLWRCGTAVRGDHAGRTFSHQACHLQDAWLDHAGGGHVRKPSTGGWHDAGDYNKYVVNAGVTVGCMLRAWEDFGPAIGAVPLGPPERGPGRDGTLPDFLAEVKWEIDWVLSMQRDDGSVYHKLSTLKFGGMVLPERETADRYFSPWGSAATADFVAMTAAASRAFRPFDPTFADRCAAAAAKGYAFLSAHLEDHRPDLKAFSTGPYQTRDDDDRLWAAAEWWEGNGDPAALQDLERRVKSVGGRVDAEFDWGNVNNLGLLTYLFSKRPGRDEVLVAQVRQHLLATADGIVRSRNAHGYARPLGTKYAWGCNGTVARQALVLCAANRTNAKRDYTDAALDALNHLLGRNVYGRSFVTGLGHRPPLHPHDRRSAADGVEAPWPGYLVGGPNPGASDWKDDEADYRTNEIAINWNGALIYATAAFVRAPQK
jgi:endoglucanase